MKTANHALILMTALVPTTGHKDLITFAANLPNTHVWVFVGERSFEPTIGNARIKALMVETSHYDNITYRVQQGDNTPQNPEDHPNFWDWWGGEIRAVFPELPTAGVMVVASEPYGEKVAESLNGVFVPYDIERQLNPARGTNVRENLTHEWGSVVPAFRHNLGLVVTVAGQESVGKTTISKRLAEKYPDIFTFSPEYARPYLEAVGEVLTEQKMRTIEQGQEALQRAVRAVFRTPVIVQDTDLYATIGYYELHNTFTPSNTLHKTAKELQSDIYFILPDDVPFTPDPLRYGGDRRESEREYWAGQADAYGLNYVLVPEGTVEEKVEFIHRVSANRFETKTAPVSTFERE